MQSSSKFQLLNSKLIPELSIEYKEYIHSKTKAKIVFLENNDSNKAFTISFATPSYSDSGVAHILEHSVLSGSRNYPVKEVFSELAKSSVNTFLNASTYPDHTAYPFASTNQQDFYNLMHVYLDSVFFPIIDQKIFSQEGYHLEYDEQNQKLFYKGVVYNEMKGTHYNSDSFLYHSYQEHLLPDTIYAKKYGGHPLSIPSLTYEEFTNFHKRYYHPSNATIVIYGDDKSDQRLEILATYLDQFEALEITTVLNQTQLPPELKKVDSSAISLQESFTEPKIIETEYPEKELGAVVRAHTLELFTDSYHSFEMQVLYELLMGKSTSIFRKKLEKSGLGQEFYEGDLDPNYQLVLAYGLKGVKPENLAKVNQLFDQSLIETANTTFEPSTIQATLNALEFATKEISYGRPQYPKGLKLISSILFFAAYKGKLNEAIEFANNFAKIRANIAQNPNYFNDLIKKYLITNPHQVTILFHPNPELSNQDNLKEQESLGQIKRNLTSDQLQSIIDNQNQLLKWQQTPDSPEALATIPVLQVSQLPKHEKPDIYKLIEPQILFNNLQTNGIVYLDLAFDFGGISQEQIPWLALYLESLLELDTKNYSIQQLQEKIGIYTGGIKTSTIIDLDNQANLVTKCLIRAKSTVENVANLVEIIQEITTNIQFDNPSKILQLINILKSQIKGSIVSEGHIKTLLKLNANLNQVDYIRDQMDGFTQLEFLQKLEEQVQQDWPSVLENLRQIHNQVITNTCIINLTHAEGLLPQTLPFIKPLLNKVPKINPAVTNSNWNFNLQPTSKINLEWDTPVNFVGRAIDLDGLIDPTDGSLLVITKWLEREFLWNTVRIQNGAYACLSRLSLKKGLLNFISYRDPSIDKTWQTYDQISEKLLKQPSEMSKENLDKTIIGTIGDWDSYKLPEQQGLESLQRYFNGQTQQNRQAIRDKILATTTQDFERFGNILNQATRKFDGVLKGKGK